MPKPQKPTQLPAIDWTSVIGLAQSQIDEPEFNEEDDNKQYIYEAVLEAVFGKKVWDYENNK